MLCRLPKDTSCEIQHVQELDLGPGAPGCWTGLDTRREPSLEGAAGPEVTPELSKAWMRSWAELFPSHMQHPSLELFMAAWRGLPAPAEGTMHSLPWDAPSPAKPSFPHAGSWGMELCSLECRLDSSTPLPGAPGMQGLPGFMGFRSSAEALGSQWVPGEHPRGCTAPPSPPGCIQPGFPGKQGTQPCQTRTPHPSPLESQQGHGAFGSQEKRCPPSLSLPLGWGEMRISQLVRAKPFRANPQHQQGHNPTPRRGFLGSFWAIDARP